jgi:hypothetical protein
MILDFRQKSCAESRRLGSSSRRQSSCALSRFLGGKDLIGTAQTATGKTAAFALQILTLLAKHGAIRCSHIAGPHLTAYCGRSLYKNAVDDRARTIFGGLIRVEPHAHFADAYQKFATFC